MFDMIEQLLLDVVALSSLQICIKDMGSFILVSLIDDRIGYGRNFYFSTGYTIRKIGRIIRREVINTREEMDIALNK